MPDLSLSLLADYPDLTGREYLRSSPTPETQARWRLAEVQQWLSLRLNHEGVLAEAVFKIPPDFLVGSGRPPSEVDPETLELWPKRLVLDRSFLFTLWQPGAEWPYFALWVDGGDVLVGE